MIVFDIPVWQVLQFAVAIVLPAVVGLVTTRTTDPGLKAVLLLVLSIASSLATELAAALQTGTRYNLGLALLFALGTFITGVAVHYGLLKPAGVSAKLEGSFRTADTIPGEVVHTDRVPGPDHRADPADDPHQHRT